VTPIPVNYQLKGKQVGSRRNERETHCYETTTEVVGTEKASGRSFWS
jgi:hypothetical protein